MSEGGSSQVRARWGYDGFGASHAFGENCAQVVGIGGIQKDWRVERLTKAAREEARVEAQRAAAEAAEQRGAELETELASARSLLRRLRGVLGTATRSRAAAAVARARAVGRGARNRVRRARERFRK